MVQKKRRHQSENLDLFCSDDSGFDLRFLAYSPLTSVFDPFSRPLVKSRLWIIYVQSEIFLKRGMKEGKGSSRTTLDGRLVLDFKETKAVSIFLFSKDKCESGM